MRTPVGAKRRSRNHSKPGKTRRRLVGANHHSPERTVPDSHLLRQERQSTQSPAKRRMPRVPPPESTIWPEEYRGENWKPAYAFIFEDKCQLCAHSCPLPKSRQLMDKFQGNTRLLHCTNHPANPGGIDEVFPTDTCRNFKPKAWKRPKTAPARGRTDLLPRGRNVKRIYLSNGLFVTVDAADYKKLSEYRWYASRHGRQIYAICRRDRKERYMHRMIMRPRKGYVVDHIDHNGLNNCRSNLRVCTRQQNHANRGPLGGTSRFVGVFRFRDKWQAGIVYRAKHYYIGVFDDEVQAAKARDRKAYELHGEFAYLNFPGDFRGRRRKRANRDSSLRSTRR